MYRKLARPDSWGCRSSGEEDYWPIKTYSEHNYTVFIVCIRYLYGLTVCIILHPVRPLPSDSIGLYRPKTLTRADYIKGKANNNKITLQQNNTNIERRIYYWSTPVRGDSGIQTGIGEAATIDSRGTHSIVTCQSDLIKLGIEIECTDKEWVPNCMIINLFTRIKRLSTLSITEAHVLKTLKPTKVITMTKWSVGY